MFGSPVQGLVFTVVFAATGMYSLVLLARGPAGTDRVAEVAHLLMSIAMIAMSWGWTGGPDTLSGLAQIAVFGLFGAWFLAHQLSTGGPVLSGPTYHVVVLGAMVWMVAATPGGGHTHHAHHAAAAAAGTGPLTRLVTVAAAALLAAAAVWWVARAVRTRRRLEASCHVLMSLGMAAMLIAMA
ncbi:DUF5134 domain-containing protein [Pseudonocardia zijingensis]|jgi:hypothetical protein|uniref:DUF5134 domain-containing protein n=1 Tax=Pseudonocardia zijingensis TaxID=153376 RepID=A0ABN1QWC5_9PSEU